jgi:hypothetical protein
MKNYIIEKLDQGIEYAGDLRNEDGCYYFAVKVLDDKNVSFENTIFEVAAVDTCTGFHLILKVEANYLEFAITTK